MHRIIDLDQALKDKDDSLIFTVVVGGERYGFGTDEVAEALRARAAAPGKGANRKGGKAKLQLSDGAAEADALALSEGEASLPA